MTPYAHADTPMKKVALVLQGGGALGSYQAGVYEVLARTQKEAHGLGRAADN